MFFVIKDFDMASRGSKCSICHNNARLLDSCDPEGGKERVIRTGVNIDFEGEFDICESCVGEMALMVNYGPDDDLLTARVDNMLLREEVEALRNTVASQELALSTLSRELAEQAKRRARQTLAEVKELAEEPDFA